MKTETVAGLQLLQSEPELLVPARLLELVDHPEMVRAIPLNIQLGRADKKFCPELSIIIVGQEDIPQSSAKNSIWEQVIFDRRLTALERGLIEQKDQVLISLIADSLYKYIVVVESYIEAAPLRGRGLVKAFYRNFESLLAQMDYQCMCAISDRSLQFCLRAGWQKISQLDPGIPCVRRSSEFFTSEGYYGGIPIIKFLNV